MMGRVAAEDDAFAVTSTDFKPRPPPARIVRAPLCTGGRLICLQEKTDTDLVASLMEPGLFADKKVPALRCHIKSHCMQVAREVNPLSREDVSPADVQRVGQHRSTPSHADADVRRRR